MHAGLVQRCKGRYEFLRQGAALAGRTRRRTFQGADQPLEYEKDMRNRPAVLECLTCTLAAILNLSVLKANQVCIVCMILLDAFVLYSHYSWISSICVWHLVYSLHERPNTARKLHVHTSVHPIISAKATLWTKAVCH